ncbi:MAG: hypothetical protein KDA32_14745, partial [Phycisphaerales bacterium]|nr:hypothetical protein [Phycisphaerales bacterium]
MWGADKLIASLLACGAVVVAPSLAETRASAGGAKAPASSVAMRAIGGSPDLSNEAIATALEVTALQVVSLRLPADVPPVVSFQINLDGADHTVILQPWTIRAKDFRVRVVDDAGDHFVIPPPPRTYRGSILGTPRSRVTASISESGQLCATIDLGGNRAWMVQPVSSVIAGAPIDAHAVWRVEDVLPSRGFCGVSDDDAGPDLPETPITERGVTPLICEVGVEADYEFYLANGSSVAAVLFQVEDMMAEVDTIYQRDVLIAWEITEVVIRTSLASNPYASNLPDELIDAMEGVWSSAPYSFVRHDVAHLFTGRDLDGDIIGKSNIGVICSQARNVSIAQSQFSGNRTQRIVLHAHELGHAWDAVHCNGSGDCKIMCGTLNGCGGPGSPPQFGATTINRILDFKQITSCVNDPLYPPVTPPFFDDFETAQLNPALWSYWRDTEGPTTRGDNPPSGDWVCNIQSDDAAAYGSDDDLRTNYILLGGQTGAELSYWTQSIGVEPDEPLAVYYFNNNDTWVLINSIAPTSSPTFAHWTHILPSDALHDKFRVRFLSTGNNPSDDWLIDDVRVEAGEVGLPNIEHSFVEVPISSAAIAEDPRLAGARCFDLKATLNNGDDWTLTGGVITISNGVFYKSKFIDPNNPMIPQKLQWTTHPSL